MLQLVVLRVTALTALLMADRAEGGLKVRPHEKALLTRQLFTHFEWVVRAQLVGPLYVDFEV